MYQGKHTTGKRSNKFRKSFVLLASVALLVLGAIGGTVAYLVDGTEATVNTFNYGTVSCVVNETFNGSTKSDVTIQNTGNTDAYIRAQVVVTWQDASGNVYGASQPVAGTDYSIEYGSGWKQHTDAYYYYPSAVPVGASTGVLITSCTPVAGQAPEGYTLSVEILADAVQSSPANAVTEAWGVNPGTLD